MSFHSLFVIRSPLQILNAYEAISRFKIEKIVLLMIYNAGENNTKQMKDLIPLIKYDRLIEVEDDGGSKFFRYVALIKRLKHENYEYIFSGNFGAINKLLFANLQGEKLFLIDDGTSTIITHQKIDSYFKDYKFNIREFRFVLFGLKYKIQQKIDFFTVFNLEQIDNETIIKHQFEQISSKYLSTKRVDKELVYILGQNLTQAKIVSKEKYIFYIKYLITLYKNKRIIYIPHRTEILHSELKELVGDTFNILFPNKPVEIYLLQEELLPVEIVSFHSSALYTLSLIFKDSIIKSYKINLNEIERLKEHVAQCQKFLDNTCIKIENLINYFDEKEL